jgi:predicted dehydrogenase
MTRRDFLQSSALALLAADARAAEPPKILIGQIGTHHAHAAGKWETITKAPDYTVAGLVENDPARRAAAEKDPAFAGAHWLTEAELLATPGLQAVAVETEVKDLLATAKRCLEAGKHVHLDKPAGESLPVFREIRERAEREKLALQMGYMFRYHPAFQLCTKLVREGTLGPIFSIECSMSKRMPSYAAVLPYRGGAMFELGCHVIDSVVRLLGKPAAVHAYNRGTKPDDRSYPDNQMAILEYPEALVTVRVTLAEWDGGTRRQFVVCGDKGTYNICPVEPAKVRLTLDAPHGDYRKGAQEVKLPPLTGRYDADFADLARVIRGEKALEFTAQHDLAVQETVLLASGMRVDT